MASVFPTSYLIKPVSRRCNVHCRYCFYRNGTPTATERKPRLMSHELVARIVDAAFSTTPGNQPVVFAFQGGEPLLAGKDFFARFIWEVRHRNTQGCPVEFSIQTNGLLIDDEWADLFADNGFLVGLSLDGGRAAHDANRKDPAGHGTWERALAALRTLLCRGAYVNILCVVTAQNADDPARLYGTLKNLGCRYLQFIACLDPSEDDRGGQPYSLDSETYGAFLCGAFDCWYADWAAGDYVSVRLFDDLVHLAMGMPCGTCSTTGACGNYLLLESDGSAYPCDFSVDGSHCLGNIAEDDPAQLMSRFTETPLGQSGTQLPSECTACRWQRLCHGGCKRDWQQQEDGSNRNYYCDAFRRLFAYAEDRIIEIARAEAAALRG